MCNKVTRCEVLNVREIVMPTVICYYVVAARSLSALVLQHILEVFHWLGDGCYHFLLAQIDNLYHIGHLAQCIILFFLGEPLDNIRNISKA